jgi:hypothetical protein
MSRGRPDHERRNLPFSASLRHRWWCDLVIRKRRSDRKDEPQQDGATVKCRKGRRDSVSKKKLSRKMEA